MVDSTNLNHSEQGTWEKWKALNCISRSNEMNLNVAATHVGKNKAFKHNFFEKAKKTKQYNIFGDSKTWGSVWIWMGGQCG